MVTEFYKEGEGEVAKKGYLLELSIEGQGRIDKMKAKLVVPFKPETIKIMNIENIDEVNDENAKHKRTI